MPRIEFWSMHWYGTYQRCSRHFSEEAAINAAEKCERAGGSSHDIARVVHIRRAKSKRKER